MVICVLLDKGRAGRRCIRGHLNTPAPFFLQLALYPLGFFIVHFNSILNVRNESQEHFVVECSLLKLPDLIGIKILLFRLWAYLSLFGIFCVSLCPGDVRDERDPSPHHHFSLSQDRKSCIRAFTSRGGALLGLGNGESPCLVGVVWHRPPRWTE